MEKNDVNIPSKCVLIGGSAGSLKALLHFFPKLKAGLPIPVIVVVHRKNDAQSSLEKLLSDHTALTVKEAEDKEWLQPATIYIAPAGYHLLIEKDYSLSLDGSEKVLFSRPSIDVTFQSAADAFGKGLLGIILSGANNDGAQGLLTIKNYGGTTVIQNPKNAEIPAMPLAALEQLMPNHIANDEHIADLVNHFAFKLS